MTESRAETIGGLLEAVEEIELGAARAYAAIAHLLVDGNARQRKFWLEMSREEWEHASFVSAARILLARRHRLDLPSPVPYRAALAPAKERLARVADALRGAGLTLHEAFEAAITIEESEANRVFGEVCGILAEVAATEGLSDLVASAKEAGNEGSAHVEHLIDTMKRTLGDPDLVRSARKVLS